MAEFKLPTQKQKPKVVNPRLLVLYGESKVGKSTSVSKLENALIIDTEGGTDFLEAMSVKPSNYKEFVEILQAVSKAEHKYDYIVVDTIDNLVTWIERQIVIEYNAVQAKEEARVKIFSSIPHGSGWSQVTARFLALTEELKRLTPHVILIGHIKKTLIGQNAIEVKEEGLDLAGKLKGQVMAQADAIGIMFRDLTDNNQLHVSFINGGSAAAGSRCGHLINQEFAMDWSKIFIDNTNN